MKNNKKIMTKKIKSAALLTVATLPIAVTLASCSSTQFDINTLRWATAVNMFSSSKTPLGTTFVDSPSTTYFNSVFLNLVNWQTTGDYKFDEKGNAIAWSSAGAIGYKGARKGTPFAAQNAAEAAGKAAFDQGLRSGDVFVKGTGSGRDTAIRSLEVSGLKVTSITDVTPIPHNGCRPPKHPHG